MRHESVKIPVGPFDFDGDLCLPPDAASLIVFAQGRDCSRLSARTRFVVSQLHGHGMGTLLLDLLNPEDDVFDVGLLAERLTSAIDWVREHRVTGTMHVGLFGASTGAAAALITAAERPLDVRAVVSRGGRPDLAGSALEFNRESLSQIAAEERKLEIIAGATHLFEEPGALEQVAALAGYWFSSHLVFRREPEWSYG